MVWDCEEVARKRTIRQVLLEGLRSLWYRAEAAMRVVFP